MCTCRCQAELGALQQAQEKQAHGSGAPGAVALLGRSVDDLEREVQHLQHKLEASLERCQAAAAQASLRHAAAAVAAQRAGRVEHARARCAVKQQVGPGRQLVGCVAVAPRVHFYFIAC